MHRISNSAHKYTQTIPPIHFLNEREPRCLLITSHEAKDTDIYDFPTPIPIIILYLSQLLSLFPFPITLNQPIQAYMQYTPAKEVQEKQISYIHTPCQRAIKQDKESGNRNDTNHHHPHPHPRAQQLMMKVILIRQERVLVLTQAMQDHGSRPAAEPAP